MSPYSLDVLRDRRDELSRMKNAPQQHNAKYNATYREAVRLANRLPRMLLDYNAEIAETLPDRIATRDLKQVCLNLARALALLGDTATAEQYRIEAPQRPPHRTR